MMSHTRTLRVVGTIISVIGSANGTLVRTELGHFTTACTSTMTATACLSAFIPCRPCCPQCNSCV